MCIFLHQDVFFFCPKLYLSCFHSLSLTHTLSFYLSFCLSSFSQQLACFFGKMCPSNFGRKRINHLILYSPSFTQSQMFLTRKSLFFFIITCPMVQRNRSVLLLFSSLSSNHTKPYLSEFGQKPGRQKVSNCNLGTPPSPPKMTLFLSPLLPCQFGFCSSISLFPLLPAASIKICKWRRTLKRRNVDTPRPRRPLNTHSSHGPFSRLPSWPSFRCLCLFWLSLKHG